MGRNLGAPSRSWGLREQADSPSQRRTVGRTRWRRDTVCRCRVGLVSGARDTNSDPNGEPVGDLNVARSMVVAKWTARAWSSSSRLPLTITLAMAAGSTIDCTVIRFVDPDR